jgi:hypothetical protein
LHWSEIAMTTRTKRNLKLAAAAILAAFLVALTVNVAVDFWMPQVAVKAPAPAVEPAALQLPPPAPPVAPMPKEAAADPAPWNQPLFDPKFGGPGIARSGGGAPPSFAAPNLGNILNQAMPLTQVSPPSFAAPGADPAIVSIRPIFNGKAGGVEGGAGTLGGALSTGSGTVSGATSGAGSLLKR